MTREEYEAWFIGKFGFPPMPVHSRVLDFCWEGYKAGAESKKELVEYVRYDPNVIEMEIRTSELRQQLAEREKQMTLLRDALLTCIVGDFSTGHVIYPSFDEKLVEEALAATEPKP